MAVFQGRAPGGAPAGALKAISLFSGAGGMDIGFERVGFSIAAAVEVDPACRETLKANRPDLPVIGKSIAETSGKEILDAAGLKPLEAALVIGGPPCQSFSIAGLRKGLDDERGRLLFEFVRIVRETLPAGFVLENVKGLASWDSGRALRMLIEELERPVEFEGRTYRYAAAPPMVLNAADYGVPQFRERLFLVGNRLGFGFRPPAPVPEAERTAVRGALAGLPPAEAPSERAMATAGTIAKRRERHGY